MKDWTPQNIVSLVQAIVEGLDGSVILGLAMIGAILILGLAYIIFGKAEKINISKGGVTVHKNQGKACEGVDKLSQEDQKELAEKSESTDTFADWYDAALIAYNDKRYRDVLHNLEQALRLAKTKKQAANVLFNQGIAFRELGRPKEEMAMYDEVNRRYDQDSEPGIRKQVAKSLLNKGVVLEKLDRSGEAIAVCEEIDKRYSHDSESNIREVVAMSLFNKGVALKKLDRSKKAIAVYEEVFERYGQDTELGIREQVASAMFNKGLALGELGRFEDAQKDSLQAKAIFTELGLSEEVNRTKDFLLELENIKVNK